MRAADLKIGMCVDVTEDPFFNSINREGPMSREILRMKPTVGELVYVYYSGDVCVTYPDDYEVEVYYADAQESETV